MDNIPLNIDLTNIKNLIISGGGVLGYSYIGLWKYLEDANINNKISRIIGSSAGAIFGTLFALGYTSDELYTALLSINPSDYLNITIDNILTFLLTKGLDNGETFINKFKELIAIKTLNPNITFKELYEKLHIKLEIGTTNLTELKFELFSIDNNPDLPIYLAVKASVAIPLILQPVLINNNYYCDGGLANNYPINFIKNIDNTTLGIYLSSNNNNLKHSLNNINDISLSEYLDRILKASGNFYHNIMTNYSSNTIIIDIPNEIMSTFKFNATQKDIKKSIQLGYQCVKWHIENRLIKKLNNIENIIENINNIIITNNNTPNNNTPNNNSANNNTTNNNTPNNNNSANNN